MSAWGVFLGGKGLPRGSANKRDSASKRGLPIWVCLGGLHPGGGLHPRGIPCIEYYRIWLMSGQYASYWNAFLFLCEHTLVMGGVILVHVVRDNHSLNVVVHCTTPPH